LGCVEVLHAKRSDEGEDHDQEHDGLDSESHGRCFSGGTGRDDECLRTSAWQFSGIGTSLCLLVQRKVQDD
jgi:hypothetical protein